jgi:hypothetical protein
LNYFSTYPKLSFPEGLKHWKCFYFYSGKNNIAGAFGVIIAPQGYLKKA